MKFSVDYLCTVNALPDDLTSTHNNSNTSFSDERKCRGDGEAPIMSGPQDSDADTDKSSSNSNSSNGGSKSNNNGDKKQDYI